MTIGDRLHRFGQTTSTNDEAIARARNGGSHGEVFIADHQMAGRGRLGRSWDSPPGKNLYLSLLLKPNIATTQAPLLTLVAGAAVFDALSLRIPPSLQGRLALKWPNDVYFGDKKIAGVLTETESRGNSLAWAVCGVGINLNSAAEDFSPDVRKIATSLRMATGRETDRDETAEDFLENFWKRYETWRSGTRKSVGELISFCDRHSFLKGRPVSFEEVQGFTSGKARGLTPEGHLEVETETGRIVAVSSGEVRWA